MRDDCIKEVTPFGGGSVMVWAGFSAHHRTLLHHVQGNLNGQRYRDVILGPWLFQLFYRLVSRPCYRTTTPGPIVPESSTPSCSRQG